MIHLGWGGVNEIYRFAPLKDEFEHIYPFQEKFKWYNLAWNNFIYHPNKESGNYYAGTMNHMYIGGGVHMFHVMGHVLIPNPLPTGDYSWGLIDVQMVRDVYDIQNLVIPQHPIGSGWWKANTFRSDLKGSVVRDDMSKFGSTLDCDVSSTCLRPGRIYMLNGTYGAWEDVMFNDKYVEVTFFLKEG